MSNTSTKLTTVNVAVMLEEDNKIGYTMLFSFDKQYNDFLTTRGDMDWRAAGEAGVIGGPVQVEFCLPEKPFGLAGTSYGLSFHLPESFTVRHELGNKKGPQFDLLELSECNRKLIVRNRNDDACDYEYALRVRGEANGDKSAGARWFTQDPRIKNRPTAN